METNLRQSESTVRIQGYLAEKNLERLTDPTGNNIIRGTVSIKTSETNTVTMRVYVTEKTKKGTPNPGWTSVSTLLDNYHSIADAGVEGATIVAVNGGRYDPQHFITKDGRQVEGAPRYSSSFYRSLDNNEEVRSRFRADMDVEAYVQNVRPEFKIVDGNEEETGRLICDVWVNTYNGLEKSSFIVGQEEAAAFQTTVAPGQTREFYVDIVNTETRTTIHKAASFGKGRDEEIVRRSHEQIITGASDDYATSDDPLLVGKAFPEEAIQAAIREYYQGLEAQKNGMGSDEKLKRAPASGNAGSAPIPTW